MTTLLLFSLLGLFSFVSASLTALNKRILCLKFPTDRRQAEDMVVGAVRLARTIWSCSVSEVDDKTPMANGKCQFMVYIEIAS